MLSVRVDVDPKSAQKRLGHTTPRLSLETYASATDEGDEEAAELLGARFFQPGAGKRDEVS